MARKSASDASLRRVQFLYECCACVQCDRRVRTAARAAADVRHRDQGALARAARQLALPGRPRGAHGRLARSTHSFLNPVFVRSDH